MRTRPPVLLALLACGIASALVSGAERPSGSAVMEYLAQRAVRLGADLPPIPNDRVAWEQRRDVVRRQLAEILGLPQREPMRGDAGHRGWKAIWWSKMWCSFGRSGPMWRPRWFAPQRRRNRAKRGSCCRPWSCRPAGSAS